MNGEANSGILGLFEKLLFFLKFVTYAVFGLLVYFQFIGAENTYNLLTFSERVFDNGKVNLGNAIISRNIIWTTIFIAGIESIGNLITMLKNK